MIPMKIEPELYAEYCKPGPDWLVVQRLHFGYDSIGRIKLPDSVKEGSKRFIAYGKVLAISEIVSSNEHNEYLKEYLKSLETPDGNIYVGFAFHVTGDVPALPQFTFSEDVSLILLHIEDVSIFPDHLNKLLEMHAAFEKSKIKEAEDADKNIAQARMEIIRGRENVFGKNE